MVLHAHALISVIRRWKASWKQMRRVSGMTTEETLMNWSTTICMAHVEHLLCRGRIRWRRGLQSVSVSLIVINYIRVCLAPCKYSKTKENFVYS